MFSVDGPGLQPTVAESGKLVRRLGAGRLASRRDGHDAWTLQAVARRTAGLSFALAGKSWPLPYLFRFAMGFGAMQPIDWMD